MLEIISYIASGLLTILTPILFVKIVLKRNIKVSKFTTIIIILISSLIIILTQIYVNGIIKTIMHCLIYIVILNKIYKLDFWRCILLIVIYLLISIIIDVLAIIIFIYIFKMGKIDFYGNLAGTMISNIISYISVLTLAFISKKTIKKISKHKIDSNKKIIFLLVISSICILYCFFSAFKYITLDNNFYGNILIIIAFLVILSTLIHQFIINTQISLKYDKLLDFMKTYEIEIENQRIQRHETKNQLITIKSKIYDKEKDYKVINYIDSILDEKIEVSQEHYAKFQYLPANGLKALFYFKTNEAENKGIIVSINISKRIEKSLLYNLNTNEFKQLGKLIGIYLDNAIEGSLDSKDKKMGIEIYVMSDNVEIIISNTYLKNEDKISINGKSTKGKNRGHGLLLANNIINSTNKFISIKEITDDLYIQKLIIKKSTK